MGNRKRKYEYKRSWRNLLINKPYQLTMTGVLVVATAIPLVPLGLYAMATARSATDVAANQVDGHQCDSMDGVSSPAVIVPDKPPAHLVDGDGGDVDDDSDEVPPSVVEADVVDDKPVVTIIEEHVGAMPPPRPVDTSAREAAVAKCEQRKKQRIAELRDGEHMILLVLLGSSGLLLAGLALYSIKMTHKVAGPMFKIGTYLDKLAAHTFAPVYNLRKGDHLVEFYDGFKAGYDGLVEAEKRDVVAIEAALAHARARDLASKSEEMAAAIEDLEKVLAHKKAALGELLDDGDKES